MGPRNLQGDKMRDNILNDYEDMMEILTEFFGDQEKARLWMLSSNHMLGKARPVDFILNGRTQKLAKFIHNAIEQNRGAA